MSQMCEKIVSKIQGEELNNHYCCEFQYPLPKDILFFNRAAGEINLPLSHKTCRDLIKTARPAKFGLREETIYDPQIRNVWEIPGLQINTNEKVWVPILEDILRKVEKKLLIPNEGRLIPELHNLVLYKKGQFFKTHQDSEKHDRMIATLVVLLPSEFRGGDLCVELNGHKTEFKSNSTNKNEITFYAFYSDCFHQVTPVISGNRVALVYNLILEGNCKAPIHQNKPNLNQAIYKYFNSEKIKPKYKNTDSQKLVYFLDHQYTPKIFSWKNLKGIDRKNVGFLKSAANELDLEIFLSLADVQETWTAYDEDYHFESNYRYESEEENENDNNLDSNNFQLDEIIDTNVTLSHWIDSNGKPQKLGNSYIEDEMIFKCTENEKFTPYESQYEGYMGNYGNTVDRWYHRAAVVLWPKKNNYLIRFKMNPSQIASQIISKLKSKKQKVEALNALRQILPQLKSSSKNNFDPKYKLELARKCQDDGLAKEILFNMNQSYISKKYAHQIKKLTEIYSEDFVINLLNKNFDMDDTDDFSFQELKNVIYILSKNQPNLSKFLITKGFEILKNNALNTNKIKSPATLDHHQNKLSKDLVSFFQTSKFFPFPEALNNTLEMLTKSYSTLLSALQWSEVIHSNCFSDEAIKNPHYSTIFLQTLDNLQTKISSQRTHKDWTIERISLCKCQLCLELNVFLTSSALNHLDWSLAKNGRMHVHNIINELKIPVTHNTTRIGSPYRLQLKKTPLLFKQRQIEFKKTVKEFKVLKKLQPKIIQNEK